ncbi:MAG: hypothetical protein AAB072_03190, partial [Nitrospirota bacterium]
MALVTDEQNSMMSTIAESMWRRPGRIFMFVALSLWSTGEGSIPVYAHEGGGHPVSDSPAASRHSLLKPVRPVDSTLSGVKEGAMISSASEPGQKSSKKKKAKATIKPPATESQRSSAIEPTAQAQTKMEESTSGMKPASSIPPGVPVVAGAGISTMMSGTAAVAAAAPSVGPALAAAAPGALASSVVGGPSTPSN